jgi:hypothetical protein
MAKDEFSRVTLSGDPLLRLLLELDAFRLCPPLPTDRFIDWCKKCGVDVSAELLEQFEKKGLFLPLLRVRFPIYREKRRRTQNGDIEVLGRLEDGDAWDGDVEETYVWPDFARHKLITWMDEGYLYAPETRPFVPWEEFRDTNRRRAVETYYSPFQVYTLDFQLNGSGILLNAAYLADYSEEDYERLFAQLKQLTQWGSDPSSRINNPRFDAVVLAQAIATRYSPQARGDLRTITVPSHWDWHAYAREWKANEVVASLGVTDVCRYYEMLDSAMAFADPLAEWDDLLSFIKQEAREKLQGKARLGQELRVMREMFGSIHRDLTGQTPEPRKGSLIERYGLHERTKFARSEEARRARAPTEVDLLEFVVNRYGLNPRPALVLFVEGAGEQAAIPRLLERVYGMTLAVAGIEIRNLSGVAGFTGAKKRERYGALEKVIEELHLTQTVVFVALDNEGGAPEIRKRLAEKPSRYSPKRTVIRREFIHIWERNVELDNFTPDEIAIALTFAAEDRYQFTAEEVNSAAAEFGRAGDPISRLFGEKVSYHLPKPKLLCHLVDRLPIEDEEVRRRPLLVLLREIATIAALNHKPVFVDTWYENQESGYLGHPTEGDRKRMDEHFRVLRRLQEHLVSTPQPDE